MITVLLKYLTKGAISLLHGGSRLNATITFYRGGEGQVINIGAGGSTVGCKTSNQQEEKIENLISTYMYFETEREQNAGFQDRRVGSCLL